MLIAPRPGFPYAKPRHSPSPRQWDEPQSTQAQDSGNQDIHLGCGSPPGSGADIFGARRVARSCGRSPGANVIVENKVGANGNIARPDAGG